jgi:hypothetical protein
VQQRATLGGWPPTPLKIGGTFPQPGDRIRDWGGEDVWKAPEKTGHPPPHAFSITGFPWTNGTSHNVHAASTVGHWGGGFACATKVLDNRKPAIPKVIHKGFIMTSSSPISSSISSRFSSYISPISVTVSRKKLIDSHNGKFMAQIWLKCGMLRNIIIN